MREKEKLKTRLLDGVEIPVESAGGEIIYTESLPQNLADCGGPKLRPYRFALYCDEQGISEAYSVFAAVNGGIYDENMAKGIRVESHSDDFQALAVVGTNYAVRDSEFQFITQSRGLHICDFNGYGSVIGAYQGARLTLENVRILSTGVAKTAVYCYEKSDVLLKDSYLRIMGGKLYEGYKNSADPETMVAPPWVLGITGNARGTNLTGKSSSMTVVNSIVEANQWGVLSTDMGSDMQLAVIDSDLTLAGEKPSADDSKNPYFSRYGSGYGTYVIGNAKELFYGTHFRVGTYAIILTGGSCLLRSSTGNIQVTSPTCGEQVYSGFGMGRKTEIDSDAFGIMAHNSGYLEITDGTVMRTKSAAFLLKTGGVNISVSGQAKILPKDGVILQMMDNDDPLVGAVMDHGKFIFNESFHEPAGWPSENGHISSQMAPEPKGESQAQKELPPPDMGGGPMSDMPAPREREIVNPLVTFAVENSTLQGDLWNGTGYYGGEAKQLRVVLKEKASLTGLISASETIHVDEFGNQNTEFSIAEYYHLGHVANRPFCHGDNSVAVEVRSGAVWTVTGEGILSELTLEPGGVIRGTLQVNGQKVDMAPGTYSGQILLAPKD